MLAPIYYVFCLELEWARKASAEAAAAAASASGGGEGGSGEAGAALDPEEEAAAAAAVEADAFFCFTNLMAEVRDFFCAKLERTWHVRLVPDVDLSSTQGFLRTSREGRPRR